MLTKEELISELMKFKGGDPEAEHAMADDLLIEYINDEDIAKAYGDVDKWYA
jgi:hypothetical protein